MHVERKRIAGICMALFFGFVFLAYFFPYTGDDWAWGSSIGLGRLQIFFKDYNGRYAGNLLVMALTRSKLLDMLAMAASFTLICVLSYCYTTDRSPISLLMSAFLFFLMPDGMWAQVVVWTAGFTNYVPSALITLGYLVFSGEITGNKLSDSGNQRKICLWMVLLGFVGALFVESITVFNICLAAAVIFWVFLKFRKCRYADIGFLLGSTAGAFVMFTNGAYDRIAQGEDYYRRTPVGLRDTVYFAVDQAEKILDYILFDNLPFCIVVSVLLLILAAWCIKTGLRKRMAILPVVFHGCSLLMLWQKNAVVIWITESIAMKELFAGMISPVIGVVYVFSILVMVLAFVEKDRRFRMLLPLYCAVVSLAPLLVVDPIGPRCVFIGYALMMVFTVDLLGYLCKKMLPEQKWLTGVVALAVAAQLVMYTVIFYPIHYYDVLRLDFVKAQAAEGKTVVFSCDLPNGQYLWSSTPSGHVAERYKLFYGLEEDLEFEFIPYTELEKLAKNHS